MKINPTLLINLPSDFDTPQPGAVNSYCTPGACYVIHAHTQKHTHTHTHIYIYTVTSIRANLIGLAFNILY